MRVEHTTDTILSGNPLIQYYNTPHAHTQTRERARTHVLHTISAFVLDQTRYTRRIQIHFQSITISIFARSKLLLKISKKFHSGPFIIQVRHKTFKNVQKPTATSKERSGRIIRTKLTFNNWNILVCFMPYKIKVLLRQSAYLVNNDCAAIPNRFVFIELLGHVSVSIARNPAWMARIR